MENDYKAVATAYERLVSKEDELVLKARTCEWAIDSVIQGLIEHGQELHLFIVERLLNAMREVQEEILVELSLIKIQKGLIAYHLKQARQGQT